VRLIPALSAFLPIHLRADLAGSGAEELCLCPLLAAAPEDWRLAFDPRGCRALQRRLETSDDEARVAIADKLRGHIREAVRSPHANFVVQKCIEVLRPGAVQFILDELMTDSLMLVARHKFGCRVVMRLLEHGMADQVHKLTEALMPKVGDLAMHAFGNYVVQSMISHCAEEQRSRIMSELKRDVGSICRDLYGSSVVRTILASGSDCEGRVLATAIVETRDLVQDLAHMRRGHAIIKLMVKLLDPQEYEMCMKIVAGTEGLSTSRYGRAVLQRIGGTGIDRNFEQRAITGGA